MMKWLKENRKNKKGFTLVELIVVIVIILILAAVLVPNVLKYVEQSRRASVKQDAASVLTQVQADVASVASGEMGDVTGVTLTDGQIAIATDGTYKPAGATAGTALGTAKSCVITIGQIATAADANEVTAFSYTNGTYSIAWTKAAGWGSPTAGTTPTTPAQP